MGTDNDPYFDSSPDSHPPIGSFGGWPHWFDGPFRFVLVPPLLLILILSAILAPLWVPIIVLIQKAGERQFQREMRAKGRFIEWQDLEPDLIAGRGTLVIEQANKSPIRFWWTPDDIAAISPIEIPGEADLDHFVIYERVQHPFVPWCHRLFLDKEKGTGLLTEPLMELPPGFGLAGFFQDLYPKLSAIDTVYCLPDQAKQHTEDELS